MRQLRYIPVRLEINAYDCTLDRLVVDSLYHFRFLAQHVDLFTLVRPHAVYVLFFI